MAIEHVRVETGRSRARGSNGVIYTVIEHTHYLRIKKHAEDRDPLMVEGVKEFQAWPGGDPVIEMDGRLVIVARGVVLERL